MKLIIAMTLLFTSSYALAQRNSRSSASTYTSYSSKTATVNLGMTSSALNIGARMETGNNQGALGGYFFLQTEKTDAGVPQVLSFGGHSLIKLVDSSEVLAYLAPGVGIAMVKNQGASDSTVVGPNFRYGGQIKLSRGAAIGIERFEVWNWFDSKTLSNSAFTSAVYSFSF